jgi:hypothetical protein
MKENSVSPRRATASRLAPNRIYEPQRGLNDISVLSKACYRPSLSRNEAVIRQMSRDVRSRLEEDPRVVIGTNCDRLKTWILIPLGAPASIQAKDLADVLRRHP